MIPRALYRLADALELTLEWGGERVRVRRSRWLDPTGLPVPLEVVASQILADDALLLLESIGEVGRLIGSRAAGSGVSSRLRLSLLHRGRLGELTISAEGCILKDST